MGVLYLGLRCFLILVLGFTLRLQTGSWDCWGRVSALGARVRDLTNGPGALGQSSGLRRVVGMRASGFFGFWGSLYSVFRASGICGLGVEGCWV